MDSAFFIEYLLVECQMCTFDVSLSPPTSLKIDYVEALD